MKPNHFIKFWHLSSEDRLLLGEACLALTGAALALRFLGVGRSLGRVGLQIAGSPLGDCTTATAAACSAAIERASSATGLGTCLTRSIALRRLLARRGIDTSLRIGVNRRGTGINAHAWLESPPGAAAITAATDRYDAVFSPGGSQGAVEAGAE